MATIRVDCNVVQGAGNKKFRSGPLSHGDTILFVFRTPANLFEGGQGGVEVIPENGFNTTAHCIFLGVHKDIRTNMQTARYAFRGQLQPDTEYTIAATVEDDAPGLKVEIGLQAPRKKK